MKRVLLSLFVLSLLFTSSCSEDIENNSPAIQGQIDSLFFRAIDIRGQVNDNGSISLKGSDQDRELTLNVRGADPGTYLLGAEQPNFAYFIDADGSEYRTSPSGEGKITITNHCSSCESITGTFNFVAINPGVDTIYMQKGVFFEVNYLLGGIDDDTSAGYMNAFVDGEAFNTELVAAENVSGVLTINGFVDNTNITIKAPADSPSGNYPIDTPGFDAAITIDGVVEVAQSGFISVNYINANRALLFFRFDTENHIITDGESRVDY
ncbi:hypothetical protein J1N09_01395 [Aureitalea sp. L0-47]|uniref:DUF6252 family protein n=1 Tax=Aureitalea sp. L0-47 TaxID=2816962 RepID=UPI0022388271|nr:DUF6252 family protein [Aureitalea sp. L0-47]MCW5518475.1 hypothetical protein [Aureitalea sp. L0-47]